MGHKLLDIFRTNKATTQLSRTTQIPGVSVILPVYGVEKYINRCIESLACQTLKRMEFIFIDDCSPDESMKKVEDFAKNDLRVRIYRNKENIGAGASRNRGIDLATGEYLAFMDPDDYIDNDFYERLYCIATENGEHDIAKGSRIKVGIYGEPKTELSSLNTTIRRRLNEHFPLYFSFTYEHTTAIFKRSLFQGHDASYGTNRKAEDVLFLFKINNKTNDIVFDDDAIYYYVQKKEGENRENDYFTHQDGILAIRETIDWIYETRDLNKYDCQYIADKLNARHKSYLDAMKKAAHLQNLYPDFLDQLISTIDYSRVPEKILARNDKIKELYED